MKREIYTNLQAWKNSVHRKPLLVTGARQTGKSWILRHFGKNEFEHCIIIDFEKDTESARAINSVINDHGLDTARIVTMIGLDGVKKRPDNTLIVLDEIQRCPRMFTALKYFKEEMPDLFIAASGSLMGLALKKDTRAPVGCINVIRMFPMTFYEFLEAVGETEAVRTIQSQNWNACQKLTDGLYNRLSQYIITGGMPESVKTFADGQSFDSVRQVQKDILSVYENDFNVHTDNQEYTEKIRYAWHIACELAGEQNKEKIFHQKMPGRRASDFYAAVQWLEDCGLLSRCYCVKNAEGILGANIDYSRVNGFKAYPLDTGLRLAASNISMNVFLENGDHGFMGILLEQYVHQQLFVEAQKKMIAPPAYFSSSSKKGKIEIDFMIANGVNSVPVEVKSQRKFSNPSFALFRKLYSPEKMLRITPRNFGCVPPVWSLPLPMAASAYDYVASSGFDPCQNEDSSQKENPTDDNIVMDDISAALCQ